MYKQFEHFVTVRPEHLDSYGHVNNAAFLVLFEDARWQLLDESQMGAEYVAKTQVGPVLLDLAIKYKKELKNGDRVRIITQMLPKSSSRFFTIEQTMFHPSGKVASTVSMTMGMMDLVERKLISLSDKWFQALGGV